MKDDRTVHISFTQEEISRINSRADDVGMKLPSYVRQMALTGKVKGYNLSPLLAHSEAVGELTAVVREMLRAPHPDRWAYEADIERCEDLLRQILESEQSLIAAMTRRLKR